MNMKAAADNRDIRVDLFLGIANWFIFLDHIPDNVVNWGTVRNYGFSGASDWFIFISGYVISLVYTRMMLERGFVVAATRMFKQVWRLYVAYVVLFVIYIVAIGYVAERYAAPDIMYQFNVISLVDQPLRTLARGLILQSKALNLDLLQLYIVLMACFPPVLWVMLRQRDLAMLGSLLLYFLARHFGWSLSSFPDGNWVYNPFCWQLLFVLGSWIALDGGRDFRFFLNLRVWPYLAGAYLIFALAMAMAEHFQALGELLPRWLFDAFNPNDKTNLAPYRVLHFAALTFFVTRFVSRDWDGLQRPIFQPLIVCGQQSLAVFCVGVFLSFAGQLVLMLGSGSVLQQVFLSVIGIAILVLVAYYVSWSKQLSRPPSG
jgi:hypothetical protein